MATTEILWHLIQWTMVVTYMTVFLIFAWMASEVIQETWDRDRNSYIASAANCFGVGKHSEFIGITTHAVLAMLFIVLTSLVWPAIWVYALLLRSRYSENESE